MSRIENVSAPEGLKVLHAGSGLFESPVWEQPASVLFTNVTAGGAYRLNVRTGAVETIVAHRRGMGGLAVTQDGDFVVSGREISLKPVDGSATITLCNPKDDYPETRGFNDLTVDPSAAIVAGALGPGALTPETLTGEETPPAPGHGTATVWRITRSGSTKIADDIGHTNGIGFSPDGRFAYLSDTLRRTVYRFSVRDGAWSDRRVFATFDRGSPDGLAVTTTGEVWVAAALAGEIVVLSAEGDVLRRYAIPGELTTSLCFGGSDMKTVFVTTGSHGGEEPAQILSFVADVAGLVVPAAALSPAVESSRC